MGVFGSVYASPSSTSGEPVLGDGIIDPGEDEMAELARAVQNPVANLISLPFQNNTTFKVGPEEEPLNVLNIQPVWPFKMSEDWNLITRTIIPIVSVPKLGPGVDRKTGLGDIVFTAFASPAKPGKVIWGAGPAVNIPTSTDDRLGAGEWALGPSAVVLAMPGNWVVGGLVNHLWDVGGGDTSINFTFSQWFANYNLDDGWYLISAPIITANWEASSGNRWTVPIGGGVGKVFTVGKQPVNLNAQVYYNLEAPQGIGDWGSRIQLQLMFPK
ncbi:MAG: neuromedin U [Verrucomicrobia bacterium]|nr:neuromedin U [Verrucomicrobiota bacterium]